MSQKNPFCHSEKRKKRKSSTNFPTERKAALAESDKGSYYKQEEQWPESFVIEGASAKKAKKATLKTTRVQLENLVQEGRDEAAVCKECGFSIELL